jgi:5,10-methylenetetrahydromethanopterin reductase
MTVPGPEAIAPRPLHGTGLVLRDALPWPEEVQVVQAGEETGYAGVFVPEISGREAFATLAGFAAATSAVRLGTGVVTIQARSPVATAMAAATLHEISGGRAVIGIGAGSPSGWGASRPPGSSVELTEAYLRAVHQVLAGEPVSGGPFGGEGFQLTLDVPAPRPPVWLGALGDRMLDLAGRSADGVILNWCTPERVAAARALVTRAAEAAGREPSSVTIAVYARACLGVEEPAALAALRPMTGMYASIPHYLRQLERMGLGREGEAAGAAFAGGRPEEIPESLVRALAVVGGRAQALERFAAYTEAGADLVLCYPVASLEPFSSILGTVLSAAPSPAVER